MRRVLFGLLVACAIWKVWAGASLGQGDRIILDGVDKVQDVPLAAPPTFPLSPRLILQSVDRQQDLSLAYPAPLIADHTPPTMSPTICLTQSQTISFFWTTSELTIGSLTYRLLTVTITISESLYTTDHTITIELPPATRSDYRIYNTDRSGNTLLGEQGQIGEADLAPVIYLPIVTKD